MAEPAWTLGGRTAFITGGAQGIGLETGRRLAARGMSVALVDLDEDHVQAAARSLGEASAIGLAADVTDRAALDRAVAATVERFGGIDVSVANAGVSGQLTTVLGSDPEVAERTIEIDLLGVYRTVKATLPHVVERRGYVLSVASLYAFFNPVLAAPYAMSKAGVEQLGRALRRSSSRWARAPAWPTSASSTPRWCAACSPRTRRPRRSWGRCRPGWASPCRWAGPRTPWPVASSAARHG